MSDPWATLPYRRLGLDTPHKLSDAAPEDPRIAALMPVILSTLCGLCR